MTGSASQAMDVLSIAIANFRGEVQERRWQSHYDPARGWRIAPICYIYIRKINFLRFRFGEVFGVVLERFLERFWRGLGRGFREVLGEVLKRFCIPKSY